jgi:metalloprotease
MLKFAPILLAVAYAIVMYRFSVWRTTKTLGQKSRPLRDRAIAERTADLARVLGVPGIPVNVYDVDPVNGLAAPDGQIYLTRGFVEKYQQGLVSADEIASVIAHEMGHVALGHTRRRMIDFTGQNVVFVVLTALLSRFVPFLGVWIANAISTALAAHLSRRDEYEADAYASALLIRAGIGTRAQKSLFTKLDAMTAGARPPAWLMSHPKTTDRIARIEENEAKWTQVP